MVRTGPHDQGPEGRGGAGRGARVAGGQDGGSEEVQAETTGQRWALGAEVGQPSPESGVGFEEQHEVRQTYRDKKGGYWLSRAGAGEQLRGAGFFVDMKR